jgi:hypothetical protein
VSDLFHFPTGIFIDMFRFFEFIFCVVVSQCETFMNVRLVSLVTLDTNINEMYHWLLNVS